MCGIGAVYKAGKLKRESYKLGLSLQHRGPDSAGISMSNGNEILTVTNYGDVKTLFHGKVANLKFNADRSIINVRFSTTGDSVLGNAQPIAIGNVALSHNGNLFNTEELWTRFGSVYNFRSTTDSEAIAYIFSESGSMLEGARNCVKQCVGAYNLVVLNSKGEIGVFRDASGFHPLHIGRKNSTFYAASEDLSLTALQVYEQSEVKPGELVIFSDRGIEQHQIEEPKEKLCYFEALYFMWYGSTFNGKYADDIRFKAGQLLAEKYPVDADMVVPALYSGLSYAHGYSARSGIPLSYALCKNPFVGRTYQLPDGKGEKISEEIKLSRQEAAALKNPPMTKKLKGKRIIVPDDSIVSGNVSRDLVNRLFSEVDVREIHFRVASPPITNICLAGMNHGPRSKLAAARAPQGNLEEVNKYVTKMIGATSVGYLSKEDILRVFPPGSYCFSCVDGNYFFPMPKVPRIEKLMSL